MNNKYYTELHLLLIIKNKQQTSSTVFYDSFKLPSLRMTADGRGGIRMPYWMKHSW